MIADSVADLLLPYVIFPKPEPVRSGLIELNGADSATLRSVVGIGEKSVMAIIRYRERLGGFYSVDQLAEVPQVTESNFERIVNKFTAIVSKFEKLILTLHLRVRSRGILICRPPYLGSYLVKDN